MPFLLTTSSRPIHAFPPCPLHKIRTATKPRILMAAKNDTEDDGEEVWPRGRSSNVSAQTTTTTTTATTTTPTPMTPTSPQVLAAWADAYLSLAAEARKLGIPASAIPPLPPGIDTERLRAARENLEGMIASFLSAGL